MIADHRECYSISARIRARETRLWVKKTKRGAGSQGVANCKISPREIHLTCCRRIQRIESDFSRSDETRAPPRGLPRIPAALCGKGKGKKRKKKKDRKKIPTRDYTASRRSIARNAKNEFLIIRHRSASRPTRISGVPVTPIATKSRDPVAKDLTISLKPKFVPRPPDTLPRSASANLRGSGINH